MLPIESAAIAAVSEDDLQRRLEQIPREVVRLRAENERLRKLRALAQRTQAVLSTSDGTLASPPGLQVLGSTPAPPRPRWSP